METKLKLFRPIKSDKMTQTFGANDVCCRTRPGGFPVIPFVVVNKVNGVCPQGYRDFYSTISLKGHDGQDNAAWSGEPTYHSALFSGWAQICRLRPDGKPDRDGGLNIVSRDTFDCTEGCAPDTKHNVLIRYAHGTPTVEDNASIKPGDLIMKAGDQGSSTGVHVHFAPKYCDVLGRILHTGNGYDGAFNPEKYYTNVFIIDYLHDLPAPQQPAILPTPASLPPADVLKKTLFQLSVLLQKIKDKCLS